MQSSINNAFKNRIYGNNSEYYIDINERKDINDYIRDVILRQIYDETVKEYTNEELNSSPNASNYHYINNVNYFMGMRITHNRADLTSDKDSHLHPLYNRFRKENYYGQTSQRFGDLNETTFSRYNVKYSEDGGYFGKGGFVHYFEPHWTYQNATNFYDELVQDGLFDQKYLIGKSKF